MPAVDHVGDHVGWFDQYQWMLLRPVVRPEAARVRLPGPGALLKVKVEWLRPEILKQRGKLPKNAVCSQAWRTAYSKGVRAVDNGWYAGRKGGLPDRKEGEGRGCCAGLTIWETQVNFRRLKGAFDRGIALAPFWIWCSWMTQKMSALAHIKRFKRMLNAVYTCHERLSVYRAIF